MASYEHYLGFSRSVSQALRTQQGAFRTEALRPGGRVVAVESEQVSGDPASPEICPIEPLGAT